MARQGPAAQRVELPPLTLRADIRPESVNADDRTFEVVFSTGADVERYDWMADRRYVERLSLNPRHVRLDRLNHGAPFLDAHNAGSVGDVLGVVLEKSARIADGEARARIKLSSRAAVEPLWGDIREGVIRNVSVGYRVHKYEQTEEKTKIPLRLAVDWEPFELSAVPMGADAGAHIRADQHIPTNPCLIVRAGEGERITMEPEIVEEIQTETPPPPEPNDRDQGAEDERTRIQGILDGCQAARLPLSFAQKLITEKHSLVVAQGMILDSLRRGAQDDKGPRQGAQARVTGADPLENVWRGITGAILHRIDPARFVLDDNARQYRMHSVLRAAEECLEQRGIRTRGMSKMTIAAVALGLETRAGLHTTSDFANILADVANKTLRRAYEESPPTWMPLARRIPMPDFKPVKRNQIGESPELKKILEHGEFTRGTIAEGKEQFALSTYGRIFGVTRQALVNDDLDAFGRVATGFGRAARQKESDLVWAEILRNSLMSDGIALFDAAAVPTGHANLVTGPGTVISIDNLGIGRAKMAAQKGLDALTYLNLVARFLVVPPSKQTIAEQYTTQITPAQGSNVNPFAGRLTVISEARLEGGLLLDGETIAGSETAWYLFASPDQIDIVEYGFLDGEEGPVVESRLGWEVDGLEIKARHDFAAKVIDYRGAFKNAGV